MASRNPSQKVECLNPNTGRSMKIDKAIYDLFSGSIYQFLKKGQQLTYSQLVEKIHESLREQQTKFNGSVEWYAVTVKHDMHARGIIEVFSQQGKKLHRLSK